MMYILSDNQKTFIVRDAAELVAQLHATSYAKEPSNHAWMLAAAKRIYVMHGVQVRTESYETFVEDLEKLGMIHKIIES